MGDQRQLHVCPEDAEGTEESLRLSFERLPGIRVFCKKLGGLAVGHRATMAAAALPISGCHLDECDYLTRKPGGSRREIFGSQGRTTVHRRIDPDNNR